LQPSDGEVIGVGPVEPQRALEIVGRIADALDADLQPRVLIDEVDGDRAVVDFGSGDPPSEAALQYVPPDQIQEGDGRRADAVYPLSALLYRLLTGSVPFPAARGRALRFWHAHAPRPRAAELRPELPGGIDDVIARGMAIAPESRHPSPRALIEDARRALGPILGVSQAAAASDARPTRAEPIRRRSRKALAPFILAAVGLAAGAAGYVVAGTLDDPRAVSVSAGPLQLTAPADWTRSASAAYPLNLVVADAVSVAPNGAADTRLTAGLATPAGSVNFVASVGPSPPSGELVALGEASARRYRAARVPGRFSQATIYLAPAAGGIATVACLARDAQAAASFTPRCERVAGSLRLAGGADGPARPSGRQEAGVRRALLRVNTARTRYRSRLERTRTAAAQAGAARALASVHARAARALTSLRLGGLAQPGGRAAVRALEREARAYRAAARAAVAGDRGGYAAAGRSAATADAALRRALRLLRVVGFEV
jgi:hypothetical protein